MKKSKMFLHLLSFLTIIVFTVFGILMIFGNLVGDKIPDDYIAVFHGEVDGQRRETYIYKIENGHANRGFKYINTTSTKKSLGKDKWKTSITSRGKLDWTDDVFYAAQNNNAYSYVTTPDGQRYNISEFMEIFIMN